MANPTAKCARIALADSPDSEGPARCAFPFSTSPSPRPGGRTGQAIRDTVALAQHCEALGYHRYWVSEHHNHATIVGTAPEILISAIAATTARIRVGGAGVMLPHYSAYKVAEQFRVLDAIAPGRIDLGVGRAPGSDGKTAFALYPLANQRPEQLPAHQVYKENKSDVYRTT